MLDPEAVELIKREIDYLVLRRILSWVARFAAVFGVANIVALVGIWYTVNSEAQRIAREQAAAQAKHAADAALEPAKELFKQSLQSMTSLNSKYADLYAYLGRAEAGRERIDAAWKSLDEDLRKLRDQYDRLRKADYERVERLVDILGRLPEDSKKLVERLDEINRRKLMVRLQGTTPFLRPSFVAGPARTGNAGAPPKGSQEFSCFLPLNEHVEYVLQDSNHDHFAYGKRILDIWYVAEGQPGGLVPFEKFEYFRVEPRPGKPNEILFTAKAKAPTRFTLDVFALYEDDVTAAEPRRSR